MKCVVTPIKALPNELEMKSMSKQNAKCKNATLSQNVSGELYNEDPQKTLLNKYSKLELWPLMDGLLQLGHWQLHLVEVASVEEQASLVL